MREAWYALSDNRQFDYRNPGHEKVTDYYRDLDLERAVATTRYKVDGVTFQREVFASFPDKVVVVRLTADRREN